MGYTPSTSGPSAERDQNGVTTLMGVSSTDGVTPVPLYANPSTGRLLVSSTGGGSGITSINTDTTSVQTLTVGTTGTDFAIVDNGSGDHKFNLPTASASNRGLLSSTDWSTFNGKTSNTGTVTSVSVTTANGVSGSVATQTTTPAITLTLGAITPTSVNTLTVGLGTNSIAQNTAIGNGALAGANSGGSNTAVGFQALNANTSGASNVAVGNVSLNNSSTGFTNTAIGNAALYSLSSGSGNVALGASAGRYETGSNAFYVDNQSRSNTAGDKAGALLYGTFNATPASQTLKVNGTLSATAFGTINGNTITAGTGTITITGTKTLTVADTASVSGTNTGDNATNSSYSTDSATTTLTNKRITKRVALFSANSAAPTFSTDSYDVIHITAQTAAINLSTNQTGTPVDGDTLRISITGTAAVTITMGTKFEASTVALPTTTVTTARLDIGCIWNTETSLWRVVAVA